MEELNNKLQELIKKYQNENNAEKLQKLYLIEKIFKEEKCFFKIPKEVAHSILTELELENKEEKYKEMMSFSNY